MRTLFVLRGAPASGKSTWIHENNLEPYTLSTDGLRLMYQSPITTNEGELAISQNHDTEVWRLLMELLERRMENGEFVIIDATHYKAPLINKYKDLVSKYRYRVYVVDFSNVSEEELKRRNANRGFRKVPNEVIEKMVVALADTSEVKKQYKIISPQEASDMINQPLEPFKIPENINKIVVFGDIHGCYDPLKEYFDKNPFDENTNYIFTGDYIDRGLQNKEVLEFLISLKDKSNCVFLEGNHEKWLRIFSQKDYDMEYYENKKQDYKDLYVQKLIAQLKDRETTIQKKINKNKNLSEELSKLLRESWETDPENREVYYHFELVNVPETQKELHKEINKLEHQLEVLRKHLCILKHEEFSTSSAITICKLWFQEEFDTDLGMDITNILEKKYNMKPNKVDNPIKSVEFIKRTYPQIKEIDKTELRRFCDKLAQMSYFSFNGREYLVTHGGLPCLPSIKTQTTEMIKGVGKYEDAESIDNQFLQNTNGFTCQIHGHRNVMQIPLCYYPARIYNLEGQVEFGGSLRILEICKVDKSEVVGGNTNTSFIPIEIKNNNYISEEVEDVIEEKSDLELLKEMYDSKWVQVKNLKDNVISFNFNREAFEIGKWNNITCHARGLFVDKTNGNIVARSFNKFFNHREVDDTTTAGLKKNFVFPVIGYRKENGFLGIVSKYNGKVYFFTKSSDSGDFVNWFIGCLCDNYDINYYGKRYSDIYNQSLIEQDLPAKGSQLEVLDQMKNHLKCTLAPLLVEGYSYVFECVDKDNDPHIIKYEDNKVVLLEVFKNQLKEEHLSWFELGNVEKKLGIPLKFKELEFNNWEEFEEWKDKFTRGITQWDCKHEGYVFEDINGFRVKFKSSFYKFWKQMRTVKERIQSGKVNNKTYKTKEEIQVVKILESIPREQLQKMSIIDVEDKFYADYEVVV